MINGKRIRNLRGNGMADLYWISEAKKKLTETRTGYLNGHSSYIITGINEEKYGRFIGRILQEQISANQGFVKEHVKDDILSIHALSYDRDNQKVSFETDGKYPEAFARYLTKNILSYIAPSEKSLGLYFKDEWDEAYEGLFKSSVSGIAYGRLYANLDTLRKDGDRYSYEVLDYDTKEPVTGTSLYMDMEKMSPDKWVKDNISRLSFYANGHELCDACLNLDKKDKESPER